MIVAIQIGAVDKGAVFNKSIYGCLADEIQPQNALRGKEPFLLVPQLLKEHLLPWPKFYAPSTRISGATF